MYKLCYLIVLHFVIKITLGDADENGLQYMCRDSNGTLFTPEKLANGVKCICSDTNGEFIIPRADKNVTFGQHLSTPTIEQKILQRLDVIEGSLKVVITDNEKKVDDMKVLPTENEKHDMLIASLNSIKTLIKYGANSTVTHPLNCRAATIHSRSSGIYDILVKKYGTEPFKVYCEEELFGGGWTVIARRMDGSVNFDRNWTEYKQGFGDLDGEFFIGMDKLYALTNGLYTQELIFVLEDFDYNRKHAKYLAFVIGNENEDDDAGDSYTYHENHTFKTQDRDSTKYCARYGAWWYDDCHNSNLFGTYYNGSYDESNERQGVVWQTWRGAFYSLKFVQMMIRTKST